MSQLTALPLDVLEHITQNVNKYDHIKALLNNFKDEELPELVSIMTSVLPKFRKSNLKQLDTVVSRIDTYKKKYRAKKMEHLKHRHNLVRAYNAVSTSNRKRKLVLYTDEENVEYTIERANPKSLTCNIVTKLPNGETTTRSEVIDNVEIFTSTSVITS